jgi:hypothetical protein
MLLLFPCPGIIPVPSCRPSCQTSCYAPPSSGCATAASSHLSTAPTTAPMPSCGVDSIPSPSGSSCRTRSSPSAASRPARQQTPHLAVRDAAPTPRQAPRRSRRYQAGLVFRPASFFTFPFSGAAKQRSRKRFSGHRLAFCMPWTGGTIPVSLAAVPAQSAATASEIRPLTSPPAGRRQSLGGALWRPGNNPG